jgi:membrane dipeptidase
LDLAEAQGARGLVIATHSNARALADHPRNLKDDHLRRLGALGGVVGVNFHGRFLRPKDGRGRLSDVVEQVRYISRVAGPGAVAIGSDFEGGIRPPVELRGASAYPELARALKATGVSRAQVQAAFFDNAWRVLCGKPSP